MRFSLNSFLLGWLAGVATASMARRLRPVLVELAAAGYRIGESVGARAQIAREDVDDLMAEARLHARQKAKTKAKTKGIRRAAPSNGHGKRAHV